MRCDRARLREALRLYAVTDRRYLAGLALPEAVARAIAGGTTLVQLREKGLPSGELAARARALRRVCAPQGVPLIVNDFVEAAVAADADGVHVGQGDLEASQARARVGDRILGVSVQTVEQALRAQAAGADYLGVGAVFPTGTKADAQAVSIAALGDICRAVEIPVVAIGGITAENLPSLAGSGIAGAAVVSAIFGAADIALAARALRAAADRVAT